MDTKDFDNKIADLNNQLIQAQQDADTDPLGAQLLALNNKTKKARSLSDNIIDITNKKARAVELETRIATDTVELNTILDSIK